MKYKIEIELEYNEVDLEKSTGDILEEIYYAIKDKVDYGNLFPTKLITNQKINHIKVS